MKRILLIVVILTTIFYVEIARAQESDFYACDPEAPTPPNEAICSLKCGQERPKAPEEYHVWVVDEDSCSPADMWDYPHFHGPKYNPPKPTPEALPTLEGCTPPDDRLFEECHKNPGEHEDEDDNLIFCSILCAREFCRVDDSGFALYPVWVTDENSCNPPYTIDEASLSNDDEDDSEENQGFFQSLSLGWKIGLFLLILGGIFMILQFLPVGFENKQNNPVEVGNGTARVQVRQRWGFIDGLFNKTEGSYLVVKSPHGGPEKPGVAWEMFLMRYVFGPLVVICIILGIVVYFFTNS